LRLQHLRIRRNSEQQTADGFERGRRHHDVLRGDVNFILLSPALAREWVTNETSIVTVPNWGGGSDHRPLVATFRDGNN